jgi:hypothetical protein
MAPGDCVERRKSAKTTGEVPEQRLRAGQCPKIEAVNLCNLRVARHNGRLRQLTVVLDMNCRFEPLTVVEGS